MTKINGSKTYLMGALAVVSVLLKVFEVIDYETMLVLLGVFFAGEGVALRHAIKKTEVKG